MSRCSKLRVLYVTPSFFPATAFGGPIAAGYQLCNELARQQLIDLRILTTDTAGRKSSERLQPKERGSDLYRGYYVHFCRKVVGTAIAPGVLVKIWRETARAELIHVNAMYSFTTFPALLAARLLAKPVVLSPHGALLSWRGTRSARLKGLWNRICRFVLPRDMTVFHAMSEAEGVAGQHAMPGFRWELVPTGVETPPEARRSWLPNGRLRLLFMGRLDPIKGLENLLDAVGQLGELDWTLRVYGTGRADYVLSLKTHCRRLGIDNNVEFLGFVDGMSKRAAFLQADVCVVPSFSENFGIVVAESLAHGTPVIASTGTPWRNLETQRAGRWVSNDPTSFARAILASTHEDLEAMGRRGLEWMARDYAWPAIATRFARLYDSVLQTQHAAR